MDVVLQSRPPEYGPGRFHPKAAFGHGCINVLLLGSVEIGGITGWPHPVGAAPELVVCSPAQRPYQPVFQKFPAVSGAKTPFHPGQRLGLTARHVHQQTSLGGPTDSLAQPYRAMASRATSMDSAAIDVMQRELSMSASTNCPVWGYTTRCRRASLHGAQKLSAVYLNASRM